MIEKEVILEDKESKKATIFYIKANSPKEFFSDAEDLVKELNERTKLNLSINYDMMVFEFKDSKNIPQSNSSHHMMQ